ncbi:MAG: CvpA family protein [Spirochaetes bacterium]|nr:CvpA family protein [Spirochaetota bacterium]
MDWIFTGVVILLAVRCFARGFVQEILSVASYAFGLLAGLLFSNKAIELADKQFGLSGISPTIQYVVAFVICFIAGFLVMKLIEKLIREGLEAANLDIFDKVLGLGLGIAEGLVVVSFILVVMEIQPFFDASKLLSESLFASTLLPIVGPVMDKTLGPDFGKGKISLGIQGFLNKKKK